MHKKLKTVGIIALASIIILVLGVKYFMGGSKELNKNNDESIYVEEENTKVAIEKEEFVVDIKGQVKKPNIYYLKEGSIVEDLINAAGGLTEEADLTTINRAEKLENHESLYIPSKNQENEVEKSFNAVGNTSSTEGAYIDINKASEAELDSLPGIGLAKAKSIITYREEKGKFKTIEDIKNVSGIGEGVFEKFKDRIKV